ncbi:MAG: hypothetical protein JNL70_01710 [Saprospiraceae bacterium]|nr:hypothetical protein [Saprospiraceae bacterium]
MTNKCHLPTLFSSACPIMRFIRHSTLLTTSVPTIATPVVKAVNMEMAGYAQLSEKSTQCYQLRHSL